MLTLTFHDKTGPRTVEPIAPRSTVGRGPDCTIRVVALTLSRVHAVVLREGLVWKLLDLGSSGGSFLNRRKTVGAAPIVPGDEFWLGTVTFRVGQTALLSGEELQMLGPVQVGSEAQRHVFADWLESRGELQHAEYVRAELELARSAELSRLKVLTDSVSATFRAQVSRPKIEKCISTSCPREWSKLELTHEARERSCLSCRKTITFCDTVDEGRQFVGQGQPVCVEVSRERTSRDLRPQRIVIG